MKSIQMTLRACAMALGLLLAAQPVLADETRSGNLTVLHAAARPNMPNRPTAAYMTLENAGTEADRLVAASSDAFGTIELHATRKHGDVMMMMPVDGIEVPAGGKAVLEPGGLHLMMFEGAQAFKIGDSFTLTLTFEQAGEVAVKVNVEKISGGTHHGTHGSGHGDHGDHGGHSGHDHGTTN